MNHLIRNRLAVTGVTVGGAVLLIGCLTGVFAFIKQQGMATDSIENMATFLLDYQDNSIFPYPFSIQNLLTILLAIGIADVLHRRESAKRESLGIRSMLLPEDDRTVLVPADLRDVRRKALEFRKKGPSFLSDTIEHVISAFQSSHSTDRAHQVLTTLSDNEMHRVDLRYTLLRYLAWTIPTIGFIGTVVGLAGALVHLRIDSADLEPIVASLSTAFYTTILALCYSAFLVFLIQFTQKLEEETINESADYCLRNLVNRLYIPGRIDAMKGSDCV